MKKRNNMPLICSCIVMGSGQLIYKQWIKGLLYLDGYFLASDTDLLINWLYNLSIDNNYYGIGAAISLIIFFITSVFSIGTYVNSSAFKKEDTYR